MTILVVVVVDAAGISVGNALYGLSIKCILSHHDIRRTAVP